MNKLASIIFLFVIATTTTLHADSQIKILKTAPEKGTYTEVGQLHAPLAKINDPELINELKRQASNLGAEAILLYDKPAQGASLIMTENRPVPVGLALKSNK